MSKKVESFREQTGASGGDHPRGPGRGVDAVRREPAARGGPAPGGVSGGPGGPRGGAGQLRRGGGLGHGKDGPTPVGGGGGAHRGEPAGRAVGSWPGGVVTAKSVAEAAVGHWRTF